MVLISKQRSPLASLYYYVADEVRLRRTPQGGAVFLVSQALAIELDQEAITLLSSLDGTRNVFSLRKQLCQTFKRNVTLAEIDRLVKQFVELGIVRQTNSKNQSNPPTFPEIKAPECVHIQLTDICNYRCPSCYLILSPQPAFLLTLEKLQTVIDELANIGVFQLALGGGEPLMSPFLVPVIRHAHRCGILANITTNGSLINEEILSQLAGYIGEIRLSCNDGNAMKVPGFFKWARKIKQAGISLGFNLIVTSSNLVNLKDILVKLQEYQPTSLVLIRPKPGLNNDDWYNKNRLSAEECQRMANILSQLDGTNRIDGLALDCAFSSLFQGLQEKQLQQQGVQGCSMGERFCVIKWNGDVYPCSHVHDPGFCMGNIMTSSFTEIWNDRTRLPNQQHCEGDRTHQCERAKSHSKCNGCKAIALHEHGNIYTKDPGCSCNLYSWGV